MPENSGTAPGPALDAPDAALAAAVLDVVRHLDADPLHQARYFALVPSGALLEQQPSFAMLLDDVTLEAARADPLHLTPVELDDVPADPDPGVALSEIAWPDIAAGGAVAIELTAVTWAEESARAVAERLGTGAPRAVVAATADGRTWCAVRGAGRSDLVLGPRVVPELVDALAVSVGAQVEGDPEERTGSDAVR